MIRLMVVSAALGVRLTIAQGAALTVFSIVGGLVPTVGGLGAIEGSLVTGLLLFGVSAGHRDGDYARRASDHLRVQHRDRRCGAGGRRRPRRHAFRAQNTDTLAHHEGTKDHEEHEQRSFRTSSCPSCLRDETRKAREEGYRSNRT